MSYEQAVKGWGYSKIVTAHPNVDFDSIEVDLSTESESGMCGYGTCDFSESWIEAYITGTEDGKRVAFVLGKAESLSVAKLIEEVLTYA